MENEGFGKLENEVVQVGDVMYDAALFYAEKSRKPNFDVPERFILTTCHRAENTDDPTIACHTSLSNRNQHRLQHR